MKRILWTSALLWLLSGAFAQDVRSLGLGGLTLPGPAAADRNPAYAAYTGGPYGSGGGFALPLGLINLALRPSISPLYYFRDRTTFKNNFDLLAFYDQVTHLNEYVINPPESPREIVFQVSANGVSITDGSGNPLELKRYTPPASPAGAALPAPIFRFSIPSGVPGLRLSSGAFLDASGVGLIPDEQLRRDLAAGSLQPNTTYRLDAVGKLQGGVSATVGFASPLPRLPGFDGRIYAGAQLRGFYGLVYADAKVSAETTTDDSGRPGPVGYATDAFYVYPGQGQGYGGQLDVGVALDYQSGTYGLGIKNLMDYQRWDGRRRVTDTSGNVVTDTTQTRVQTGLKPSFYANAAYLQTLEGAGELLLGADVGYAQGSASAHLGSEYRLGPLRLRGGLGYEGGLQLGLGAGFELGPVRTDLALTHHAAPFTGASVFGVAASLGFVF